ncbi:hypothetical protein FA95DRAFT_1471185, partial [Auriscalpium vulgare]
MVGCELLLSISDALMEAKGSTEPFGGVNIIFAGDLAQLPPVSQTRLHAQINARSLAQGGTKRGQNAVFGKLLWLSVRVVIELTQIVRQSGIENERFVALLSRLRFGQCTDDDYDLLNTRLLERAAPDWAAREWQSAPMIVAENVVKDALNQRAALAFAERTGRPLHWYHAVD